MRREIVFERVLALFCSVAGKYAAEVTPDAPLLAELEETSPELLHVLVAAVEAEFGVVLPEWEVARMIAVDDLVEYILADDGERY